MLKRNHKSQDLKLVKTGVKNAINAGLVVQAYFVIGLPGETVETFQKTLKFGEILWLYVKDLTRRTFLGPKIG